MLHDWKLEIIKFKLQLAAAMVKPIRCGGKDYIIGIDYGY
jgi:hypothetical protein